MKMWMYTLENKNLSVEGDWRGLVELCFQSNSQMNWFKIIDIYVQHFCVLFYMQNWQNIQAWHFHEIKLMIFLMRLISKNSLTPISLVLILVIFFAFCLSSDMPELLKNYRKYSWWQGILCYWFSLTPFICCYYSGWSEWVWFVH